MKRILTFLSLWCSIYSYGLEYEYSGLKFELDTINFTAELLPNDLTKTGRSVKIPDEVVYMSFNLKVTKITSDAFQNNSNLTTVILPEYLESIDAFSFSSCRLREITIPKTVTYIGELAFLDNDKLDVYLNWDNSSIINISVYSFYFKDEKNFLIPSNIKLYIPAGTERFYDYRKSLEVSRFMGGIIIPVMIIPSEIFTCEYIGLQFYLNPADFTAELLDNDLTLYGTRVEIPDNVIARGKIFRVRKISNSAFENNSNLILVTLSDYLKSVSSKAFYGCSSLKSIEIPRSVEVLESDCFRSCSALETVTLNKGLKEIRSYAFSNCASLKSIEIPNTVDIIGEYCFANCFGLETILLPDGLNVIKSHVFDHCSSLKSIEIPRPVGVIEDFSFAACSNLEAIILPEGLKTIGNNAFAQCSSLKTIRIPRLIEVLEEHVFQYCSNLETVILQEGLKTIGTVAFGECLSLKSIEIPLTVNSVAGFIFSGCDSLDVYLKWEYLYNVSIDEQAFYFEDKNGIPRLSTLKLHIPEGTEEVYGYDMETVSRFKGSLLVPMPKPPGYILQVKANISNYTYKIIGNHSYTENNIPDGTELIIQIEYDKTAYRLKNDIIYLKITENTVLTLNFEPVPVEPEPELRPRPPGYTALVIETNCGIKTWTINDIYKDNVNYFPPGTDIHVILDYDKSYLRTDKDEYHFLLTEQDVTLQLIFDVVDNTKDAPRYLLSLHSAAHGEIVLKPDSQTLDSASVVMVKARPEIGYSFDGWLNQYGQVVSRDAAYTFRIISDTYLTARFIVQRNAVYDLIEAGIYYQNGTVYNPAGYDICLYDTSGKLIIRFKENEKQINVSKGIYLITGQKGKETIREKWSVMK
ncbi:hypothetical protein Barb4_00674 [Bacteroidales bacterium Barb4]|nr:hypothetical protein Barb4_00674 [Bacteroidales bacterium Barb4]